MSTATVELARARFAKLADEGFESLLPYLHPDFEMETRPGLAAEPQAYRGEEGMRRWWESFYEVMDDIRVDPTAFHDAGGDRVIVEFRLHATGRSSGLEVTQEACMLIEVRDELLLRIEPFATVDEARAAAG